MSTTAQEPPSTSSTTTSTRSISHPPNVTISSAPEYARRLIDHLARSFLTSPTMIAITAEVDHITHPPFDTYTYDRRVEHFESGSIIPSVSNGAFIAEADNWTAAALWEAPGFRGAMATPSYQNPLPILKEYIAKSDAARARYLDPQYRDRFWHLSFLARDPERRGGGKGAVSAVVRPFLERARAEAVPAWLESVDVHAVEVYEHYGFRVCEKMVMGEGVVGADGWPQEGGDGFVVWAMVFDAYLRG